MEQQFPRHLSQIPNLELRNHFVLIPAFLGNSKKLYSIKLKNKGKGKGFEVKLDGFEKGYVGTKEGINIIGSGEEYFKSDLSWQSHLLKLIKAYDLGKIPASEVANYFASLNFKAHKGNPDNSVGPNCIVAWRNKKPDTHKQGSGQFFYKKESRKESSDPLPQIAIGIDIGALIEAIDPIVQKTFDALDAGEKDPKIDKKEMDEALAKLPKKPKEDLK